MEFYWVSAIVQNEHDSRAWCLGLSDSVIGMEAAMEAVNKLRTNYTVLSAWIDVYDENHVKHTVFHECYVNCLGFVRKPIEEKEEKQNGNQKNTNN